MEVAAAALSAFPSGANRPSWERVIARCRKLGTSTIVFVKREQFRLTSGEEDIETVVLQPPYKYIRSFCRRCGTSLGEPLSPEASFPINAQCLDDDPVIRNTFFEFVSDLPAWLDLAPTEQEIVDHNQSLGTIQK